MMKKSKEMGGPNCELIVGILTDAAIIEKKPHPIFFKNEAMALTFVLNEIYNPGLSLNTKEDLTNMLSGKILQLESQGGRC